ncbi:MAG TPA: hypothetical protein VKG38_18095 [Solirubrobacteraceae bacterium]|nr:hypothetical protein [Solirubrobacteraceae bacterium]
MRTVTVTTPTVSPPIVTRKTSPTGTTPKAPPPRPRHRVPPPAKVAPNGEQSLAAIADDNEVVALSDGTVWSLGSAESWSTGDKITVGESEDTLYDGTEGESVDATKIGEASDANPYPSEGEHTQEAISDDGSLIVLDDGSVWAVSGADQATAATWTDASTIEARQGSASPRYRLVNTGDESTVEAGYMGDK